MALRNYDNGNGGDDSGDGGDDDYDRCCDDMPEWIVRLLPKTWMNAKA